MSMPSSSMSSERSSISDAALSATGRNSMSTDWMSTGPPSPMHGARSIRPRWTASETTKSYGKISTRFIATRWRHCSSASGSTPSRTRKRLTSTTFGTGSIRGLIRFLVSGDFGRATSSPRFRMATSTAREHGKTSGNTVGSDPVS